MVLMFLLLAGLMVAFAVRPVASIRATLQVVLLFLATAAAATVYVAGPEPLFIGIALICGSSWVALTFTRPPPDARAVRKGAHRGWNNVYGQSGCQSCTTVQPRS